MMWCLHPRRPPPQQVSFHGLAESHHVMGRKTEQIFLLLDWEIYVYPASSLVFYIHAKWKQMKCVALLVFLAACYNVNSHLVLVGMAQSRSGQSCQHCSRVFGGTASSYYFLDRNSHRDNELQISGWSFKFLSFLGFFWSLHHFLYSDVCSLPAFGKGLRSFWLRDSRPGNCVWISTYFCQQSHWNSEMFESREGKPGFWSIYFLYVSTYWGVSICLYISAVAEVFKCFYAFKLILPIYFATF